MIFFAAFRSASRASTIAQYPSSQAMHIGYSVMAWLVE
jgi:hypothetical protein